MWTSNMLLIYQISIGAFSISTNASSFISKEEKRFQRLEALFELWEISQWKKERKNFNKWIHFNIPLKSSMVAKRLKMWEGFQRSYNYSMG